MLRYLPNPLGYWKRRIDYIAVLGLALAVIAVMTSIWMLTTTTIAYNSDLCGRLCHAVNPEYQAWKRATHGRVACRACHAPAGLPAYVNRIFITQPKTLYLFLTKKFIYPLNNRRQGSLREIDYNCRSCHEKPGNGLRIQTSHSTHGQIGIGCTVCHNRAGHEKAERYPPLSTAFADFKYPDFLTMRGGCWRCHTTASRYSERRFLKHFSNSFPAAPGCLTCHQTKDELTPDNGAIDHDPRGDTAWSAKARHGKQTRRSRNACLPCHDVRLKTSDAPDCAGCHRGISMPHPANSWLMSHPTVARRIGKQTCAVCHKSRRGGGVCGSCHHRRFNRKTIASPWLSEHSTLVRQAGAVPCLPCHKAQFCADCHIKN